MNSAKLEGTSSGEARRKLVRILTLLSTIVDMPPHVATKGARKSSKPWRLATAGLPRILGHFSLN